MQQLIEEVTRRLVNKLPESKAYYSLSDLHDFQIPEFMINRIELELRRNLADSVVPPETDWANMQSPNVMVSWEHFLKAIHEQVRLPKAYAKTVFEVCVADILELLTQPRKHMTEVLFEDKKELKFEEIRQAANLITVYHYLPDALIKYMHRKQLPNISKEKAQQIIVLVDEKITSGYTPLNWAQLIDPFYVLLGDAIDTELLRQFFEDKGKLRWAAFFDQEKADITRTRFIEVLSMPEVDGIEPLSKPKAYSPTFTKPSKPVMEVNATPTEEKQPNVDELKNEPQSISFGLEKKEEHEEQSISTSRKEELKTTIETKEEKSEPLVESKSFEKPVDSEKPLMPRTNYVFNEETMEFEKVVEYVREDELEESEPISSKAEPEPLEPKQPKKIQQEVKQEVKQEIKLKDESISEKPLKSFDPYSEILQSDKLSNTTQEVHPKAKNFENIDDDDIPIYKKLEMHSDKEEAKPLHESIKQDEDIPFWKRFMPLDPPQKKQPVKKEIDPSELFDFLAENEDIYISDIFGGYQNTYVEAITELAGYVYWEEASRYIKEEIFRVNRISPLDDAALDFISRLQEWFTNK